MSENTAIVMRSTGSQYTLRDELTGEISEAVIRGKLRLKGIRSTNPLAVGDLVRYDKNEQGGNVITSILPRRNYVIRRSPNLSRESHIIAANVDRAVIVATLFFPETSYEFIDRFLVTCQAYNIPASIVLNKIDMARAVPGAVEEFTAVYNLAGYDVTQVSATTGENMDVLAKMIGSGTTLISGNSGVGKSTIIKYLDPDANVRTGEISDYHHKGRHTTTFSTMYITPSGGRIIDTPGIKGFGLIDIDDRELSRYFPEMMSYSRQCRFYNCTHVHEPGCAVMEAVDKGKIAASRYVSYVKILEEDEKYRK